MPKPPAPRGARPRQDVRRRGHAALTPEPVPTAAIAERAGLPGRERAALTARKLLRLKANGLAISEQRRNWTCWRSAAVTHDERSD